MYTIKGTENFAILDSPGDTENDEYLQFFSKKGYTYSKMLIYIINEKSGLDSDSIGNNEKLKTLLNLRRDYKIPLLILLTHSDNYCEGVKKVENEWKETCKKTINDNKSNLLKFIKENNYNIGENDIMHIVLTEEKVEMTLEEKVKNLDDETREEYENSDEAARKIILRTFYRGKNSNNNEVKDFLDKEIKILRQKELIKKIKEKLPSQYHSALIQK